MSWSECSVILTVVNFKINLISFCWAVFPLGLAGILNWMLSSPSCYFPSPLAPLTRAQSARRRGESPDCRSSAVGEPEVAGPALSSTADPSPGPDSPGTRRQHLLPFHARQFGKPRCPGPGSNLSVCIPWVRTSTDSIGCFS